MTALRRAVGDAPFIFVVGKGGVGKTTAAGALAVELADEGEPTHLISTDPAHSLADLFGQEIVGNSVVAACAPRLILEEFDAAGFARDWVARSLDAVIEIVEHGTYLDGDDVAAFGRLALPGVDEVMAVLRLTNLAAQDRRVVVDTAPTGHTLRLLDAAAIHDAIAGALRAMADKAAAVAGSLTGRAVRLTGESLIDELQHYVDGYRTRVLGQAAFVVADRPDVVVAAETDRLVAALKERGLRVAATITTLPARPQMGPHDRRTGRAAGDPARRGTDARLQVPWLDIAAGCDGLRAWRRALQPRSTATEPGLRSSSGRMLSPPADTATSAALPWLLRTTPRLLLFAGKGGVGKTTCAAAAALALAETRDVLLCSVDPAGSLDDVLLDGPLPDRLVTQQVDPAAELARVREAWRADLDHALARIGAAGDAALDRRVVERLWSFVPPGIDELAALAAILAATGTDRTIVLDTAPTGHFLRLLAAPGIALDWTHQLMRVVVKYHLGGSAGGAAAALLQLARELRALQATLLDGARAAVIVVTMDQDLVTAETNRLVAVLQESGVRVAAVLHNHGSEARARLVAAAPGTAVICAPGMADATGTDALREFVGAWKIVE
jgi:arsenite/tail-anchored protein-transporting ATPase